MNEYDKKDFGKLLKSGTLEGNRWMKATDSEAVRIYDRQLSSFPVTVELFGKCAKVVDYSEDGMSDEDILITRDIVNRMAYIESDRIFFQRRKKREGIEQHTTPSDVSTVINVKENGLIFEVDLTSHIDTGLFLDMVNVRSFVRDIASGLKVLNLFSYTGSFSVYAANGGAETVTSVDLSNTYSAWAERNLKANGFIGDRYSCVRMDADVFLDQAKKDSKRYNLVIFDPPAFSNSHKMEKSFDIARDYLDWIYRINQILEDKGILIFSSNLGNFGIEKNRLKQAFKVTEVTRDIQAQGFVKGKAGSCRVWVLEKTAQMKPVRKVESPRKTYDLKEARSLDVFKLPVKENKEMEEVKDEYLDRLVLTMEADEAEVEAKRAERAQKRENRPRREFSDRPRKDREFGSRDRRDFRDKDERRSDRPRRDFSDRPRRDFEDRPRRDFSDRPRRDFEDRPRRDFSDRPKRDFEDRPRREFSDRPRRDFEDRPRRDFSDRPRRDFEDRPRKDFSDRPRKDFSDRPRRDFDDRPRRDFDREDRPRTRYGTKGAVKPYGYDNIRSSRDRSGDGKSSFFWRNKEEENK
ncbi:MAG: class I SAM-dependent methyltransferase [Sphaerochaetaceae bacterium]|nr:class I SAM-dependent methyltransferase [Sphaerochaetaceae bacterium]